MHWEALPDSIPFDLWTWSACRALARLGTCDLVSINAGSGQSHGGSGFSAPFRAEGQPSFVGQQRRLLKGGCKTKDDAKNHAVNHLGESAYFSGADDASTMESVMAQGSRITAIITSRPRPRSAAVRVHVL
ncbi:hypothetical protein MMC14_005121 [Varicellaria rhodocarpa]|nr:hypothetical protein [Varicellaria rhodocarpa]